MQYPLRSGMDKALAVCAIFLSILVVGCDRGPKRALRLNLAPGAAYALSVRASGETTLVDPAGKEMKIPVSNENVFLLRPERTDERGDLLVAVEAGKTVFPIMYAQLSAAFQGYKFGIKLSPDGRVAGFSDTDAIRKAIGATIPGREDLLDGISDDALRGIIEPVTAIWPPVPVSAGDEWSRADIFLVYSDMIDSTKFHLDSWDNSAAVIKFESVYRPANKKNPDLKVTGKATGEIHIAPADGMIRSYESTGNTSGTFTDRKTGAVTKIKSTYRIQAELTSR